MLHTKTPLLPLPPAHSFAAKIITLFTVFMCSESVLSAVYIEIFRLLNPCKFRSVIKQIQSCKYPCVVKEEKKKVLQTQKSLPTPPPRKKKMKVSYSLTGFRLYQLALNPLSSNDQIIFTHKALTLFF